MVVGTGTRGRKARRVGTGTHGAGYTAATVLVVVVVGTRTRRRAALSPRPRALEEADRVRLMQYRRRRSPVVFGEVGDVAHRRVLPARDRGVEARRLPPRRRREVGQRAAAEAAALTCVCFCHLELWPEIFYVAVFIASERRAREVVKVTHNNPMALRCPRSRAFFFALHSDTISVLLG